MSDGQGQDCRSDLPEPKAPLWMVQMAMEFCAAWTMTSETEIDLIDYLRQAHARGLEEAAKIGVCRFCRGKGEMAATCPDPQCGDSTWDHACELGGYDPCKDCDGKSHGDRIRALKEGG